MMLAVFRNELIKTVKRLAFWVAVIFFTGIMTIDWIERYLRAKSDPDRTFALPSAWPDILGDDVEPVFIFAAVMLILLIANEFTWRTARQNVIDGLSKSQWFVGKLMLIPFLVLVFYTARVFPGVVLAALGEGGEPTPLGSPWRPVAGILLGMAGVASLAFFIAMAVRSAGAAMGVWLLWFVAIENLIATGLRRVSESLEPVVEFFPSNVFQDLLRWMQHDPVAFRAAVDRALERGRAPPEIWDSGTLVLAGITWIVVLLGSSFLWFQKRDL